MNANINNPVCVCKSEADCKCPRCSCGHVVDGHTHEIVYRCECDMDADHHTAGNCSGEPFAIYRYDRVNRALCHRCNLPGMKLVRNL